MAFAWKTVFPLHEWIFRMGLIDADPISFTTHHLRMALNDVDNILTTCTGFLYVRNEKYFLITNWHNVSKMDPFTGQRLSQDGRIPNNIFTGFREKGKEATVWTERIPLYEDPQMGRPIWLEHPHFLHKVDVIAVPIEGIVSDKYRLVPINNIPFGPQFSPAVADDVFIVGYPFAVPTDLAMPIWKKGSIASEPDIDLHQTPKMFVDTATKPGLSGSPVIMQRVGVHGMTSKDFTGSEIIGRIRSFIGVYSGRVGDDENKAQLGIVWKARVIDEIIDGNKKGEIPPSLS